MSFCSPAIFVAVVLLALTSFCHGASEYFWTVKVMPGMRECFYETVEENIDVEAEFQVLSGGNQDIGFEVTGPDGRQLFTEAAQDSGDYDFKSHMAGDYEFCLNNQMTSWSEKVVYLELLFDREVFTPPSSVTSGAEMTSSLDVVQHQLQQVRNIQEHLRNREARHRHTAENNESRVLYWSVAECTFVITVGIIQVITLKKLFANSSQTSA